MKNRNQVIIFNKCYACRKEYLGVFTINQAGDYVCLDCNKPSKISFSNQLTQRQLKDLKQIEKLSYYWFDDQKTILTFANYSPAEKEEYLRLDQEKSLKSDKFTFYNLPIETIEILRNGALKAKEWLENCWDIQYLEQIQEGFHNEWEDGLNPNEWETRWRHYHDVIENYLSLRRRKYHEDHIICMINFMNYPDIAFDDYLKYFAVSGRN